MRNIAAPLLLLAVAAGPAAASPFGLPPGFVLGASGEVLYDSNQIRTTIATPGTSQHRDDIRYSPTVNASYSRSTGRISLVANGSAGRDFFQYHKFLNRERYNFGGAATYHSGTACQASASGSYSRRQGGIRDTNDLNLTDDDPIPDDVGIIVDNVQTSTGYGLNANCGSPSGRLSFGGGYSHSGTSNGLASRRFSDSRNDSFSGSIGIGILRPGQLAINGSYATIAYPNRGNIAGVIVPPQLLNSGIRTYRIGLSFNRPIGTRLSGSIGASYLHSNPIGGVLGYSSPAYNVGLKYNANRLNLSLNGSRNIVASTASGAAFRVVDTLGLSAGYTVNRAWTLNGNAGFSSNDYRQSFAIPGEPARRHDSTKNLGLSMTYAPRPLYDVVFFVGHNYRTSDPSILNYGSTRASATLSVHI